MNLNKKTTLNNPCIASGEILLIRDSEIIYRKYSPKTTISTPKSNAGMNSQNPIFVKNELYFVP